MTDALTGRLFIVDDEEAQMRALCDTLSTCGYDVSGFTSGRAALQAAERRTFDLLLADLMMPEMDGIALLRDVQAIDPDVVGIIMTGKGTIATAVEAMKAGALDYILKPFKLSAIVPVLSRAIAVRRLRLENRTLARSVRERTEALEEANRDLEAFSYSVSHDLRAPLRIIRGFADAVADDDEVALPPEPLRRLRKITSNARRMEDLIEALLRLSRVSRQALARADVDMAALARSVIEEIGKESPDHSPHTRVGALPPTIADAPLVRQVFVNLLSNAFKFTERKEDAKIEVGWDAEAQAYFVADNGAGFDPRYADKLFGVFQRLHSGTEFEGTGVGLSIAHRIVHRHGGRIWADSVPGQGATFHFTLPVVD